jgi:FkbM family methyltransferase
MDKPGERPWLLRWLPDWICQSVAARCYFRHFEQWPALYKKARLRFCPDVFMRNLVGGDVISANIAFNGFYELKLSRQISRLATSGKLLVDVGANMGYFSLLWAGLNPLCRVVAFEAAPRNIQLLRDNIVENNFTARVTVVPKAAGCTAGFASFNPGSADQTGWGGLTTNTSAEFIKVPVARIDEELPDTEIEVLKIDVEGADTWVLLRKAAGETIDPSDIF